LESSGTLECLELDSKGQNASHWKVLSVVGKVLKRRYLNCPRIGNSDVCSPSYGQKKGRESNRQFDSRPLKVGNRYVPDIRSERATWRWKDLDEGYNFGSKFQESRRDNFGTIPGLHFGSPGNLCHLDVAPTGGRRVYYMGVGGGIPRVRAVVSLVVRSARGLSQHQRVSRIEN